MAFLYFYRWFKTQLINKKLSHYEVHFPHFTHRHPWGETPDEDENRLLETDSEATQSILKLDHGGVSIPIHSLSHVTHDENAEEINVEGEYYEFSTNKKDGKLYSKHGNSWGQSWKYSPDKTSYDTSLAKEVGGDYGKHESSDPRHAYVQYDRISPGAKTLPGTYSWWGLHPHEEQTDSKPVRSKSKVRSNAKVCSKHISILPHELQDAIKSLEKKSVYVPNYMAHTPTSRYGNNCFYSSFKDSLESYATSRKTETSQLCLKVGGTLRYTNEICHVVIVCKQDDAVLSSYAPITPQMKSGVLEMRGLVDRNGKVKDVDAIPEFQPHYVISKIGKRNLSYENLAFAFYFSKKKKKCLLRCRKDSVKRLKVRHTQKQCIKTRPNAEGIWKCPNNIKRN